MTATTGIQNKGHVSYFAANLEVRPAGSTGAYTRLASVRGVAGNVTLGNTLEIKADDNQLLTKYFKPGATITITDWIEIADPTRLEILLGGTVATTAASPVTVTDEDLAAAGSWVVGQPLKINNKNGANTIVTSITVSIDGGADLVAGTDYNTYVGDGENGELGYTYIVPITANANAIVVDYTYTPNASKSWSITIESTALPALEVRLIGYQPEDNTKTRIWSISSASMNTDFSMQYVDVIENGDFGKTALEFIANEGATVRFEDEVDASTALPDAPAAA